MTIIKRNIYPQTIIEDIEEIIYQIKIKETEHHIVKDKFTGNILEVDDFGVVHKIWFHPQQLADLMMDEKFKENAQ